MKRAGRMSPLVVVGLICILLLIPLFIFTKKGPETTAAEFMVALGKGDVDKLAEISLIGNDDLEKRKQDWQQSVQFGKHYYFTWRITDVVQNTQDTAAIRLQLRRNLQLAMGTDEMPFELPMKQVNGKWMVDVGSMDRDIYPSLPRP